MKSLTPRLARRAQDRLIVLLGNTVEGRSTVVAAMLRRDASEATSYWLQLGVSIGIATLGLVLGSTAVVIGAMLVAPLMGPIVGLAMGLAAGSPFLVLRSSGRIALSVTVAISGAALITLLLPFYEMNAEIAARASPTVLDLVTAAFCALAAVYASVRSSTDTTATAAGTAVSISLVPPLCACGYGLGTTGYGLAGGAALLFLTNLVAIVVVGTVGFVAAGFNQVDVIALEREELGTGQDARISRTIARRLSRIFESRFGPALRFLMPFVLLGAVYVPLRRALDDVAWEVRVRAAVLDALAAEPRQVVQSHVRVERHEIDIVLVLLGQESDAELARTHLEVEIRDVSGVVPRIEVVAIPDASAFAGLASTLLTPRAIETPPPTVTLPTPDEELDASRARVRTALVGSWPSVVVGVPLAVGVGTSASGPLSIRVVHLGPALGADATEAVRLATADTLGREVALIDLAVPREEISRSEGDLALVSRLAAGLRAAGGVEEISLCITRPEPAANARRPIAADVALDREVDALLVGQPRVSRVATGPWSLRFVTGDCAPATSADNTVDAGAPP